MPVADDATGAAPATDVPWPPVQPPEPPEPPTQEAPGLREQIGATRAAAKRLAGAHVELAKAEFSDIADGIKQVAALVGIAVGAGIVAGLILTVGLPLLLGEWLFGSLGWGVLHGLLLMVGIAIAATLVALGSAGAVGGSFLVAVVIGIVVGIALGLDLTNRGWGLLGDRLLPVAAPDVRPLAAAVVVLPIVAGVLLALSGAVQTVRSGGYASSAPGWGGRIMAALPTALFVGWLAGFGYSYPSGIAFPEPVVVGAIGAGVGGALVVLVIVGSWAVGASLVTGLGLGVVLGLLFGGLTAIAFGPRTGAAMGVTAALFAWPALMGAAIARRGVDTDALKARFMPEKTIEITKETIEWARARMPLSRRS